jgi:hypothetical protein
MLLATGLRHALSTRAHICTPALQPHPLNLKVAFIYTDYSWLRRPREHADHQGAAEQAAEQILATAFTVTARVPGQEL